MTIDEKTHHAIKHTFHCLVGCGVGEVVGMLVSASFGWHRIGRLTVAIVLAFFFGYLLTYRGVRKQTTTAQEAIKVTMATDTVSIVSMELIDNTIELIIPNALIVTATSFRFWWGLAAGLLIAFIATVPVNRYAMSRTSHHH